MEDIKQYRYYRTLNLPFDKVCAYKEELEIPLEEYNIQEYSETIRQQTLEEAIASLPEEAIKWMYEGNKNKDKKSAESFNYCRQQTLSNLQALKDKNYDK